MTNAPVHFRTPFCSAFCVAILFALLTIMAPVSSASPILAWDITGGSVTSLSGTPRANGAQFSVIGSQTVVALGMWDEGANGLLNSHPVQLWSDGGVLLASANVDNSSVIAASADVTGRWLFTGIAPLTLSTGTYRIAVGYGAVNDDPVRFGSTAVTSVGANYIQEAFSLGSTTTMSFPDNLVTNPLFAANLEFGSASTPEPTGIALVTLGCAAMFLRRRLS